MPPWVLFAGLLLALAALFIASSRALTLLTIRVDRGRVVWRSGRAPPELLRELADVVERTRATGRITLRRDRGGVEIVLRGLDAATAQRVRNVVGRFPAARIRQAPRIADPPA